MARYTGAVCRLCRRAGEKLLLKGEKCATLKCAWAKRGTPPGGKKQFGKRPRKTSDRGLNLMEKQKVKQTYGILERQMRLCYARAKKTPGMTGSNMFQLLERRLDNIVFRLGFASSRAQARQVVNHGHIKVNGRRVDIPSYLVKPGDVITWREESRDTELCKKAAEGVGKQVVPSWLILDASSLLARVLTLPSREELDIKFDDKAVVAYYSR